MATLMTGKQVKKILELLEDVLSEQIQRILESGLLTDLRDANLGEVTTEKRAQIRQLLGLEQLDAKCRVDDRGQSLLRSVGTVTVPSLPALGRVSELFVQNVSESARVKISFVGDNFKAWFGGMDIGVFAGSTLAPSMLTRNAWDSDILKAIGGESAAETSLPEVYWLMEQQRGGGSGSLLTDGRANIFYVRDKNGALRAVYVHWDDFGWLVDADEIGLDYWLSNGRVFSRAIPVNS